jgi:ABC-type Na+ efflux pump permease subunit
LDQDENAKGSLSILGLVIHLFAFGTGAIFILLGIFIARRRDWARKTLFFINSLFIVGALIYAGIAEIFGNEKIPQRIFECLTIAILIFPYCFLNVVLLSKDIAGEFICPEIQGGTKEVEQGEGANPSPSCVSVFL